MGIFSVAFLIDATLAFTAFGEEASGIPLSDTSGSDSLTSMDSTTQDTFRHLIDPAEESPLSGGESDTAAPSAGISQDTAAPEPAPPVQPLAVIDTLGGNLPRVIQANNGAYLVTSDIYVPSGKTVTINPGVILLFKNFTELHVEGRLIAEGTGDRPVIFTSEFDRSINPGSPLNANPFDWNGIFIHENGLGSSFAHGFIQYTVYGINALTRYVKIDKVTFRNNGRSDLTVEGKKHPVTDTPYSYALTINDAKRDGVPVAILMDPQARKRNAMRYGGFSLVAGGVTMGVWSLVLLHGDQKKLDTLSEKIVVDQNSPLVSKLKKDWDKARDARNRDRWLAGIGALFAVAGSAGVTWSFRF